MTTPPPDPAELVTAALAVPGVTGMVPGIASTLRTLDARMRREKSSSASTGMTIDRVEKVITAEIGVDGSRPVREVVRDVQEVLSAAVPPSEPMTIHVRVQTRGAGEGSI